MTIIESVGWVLVHFIWQGTAIALALAALLAVIPTARATVRYVLSCGALALMLAATLATAAGIAMQRPAIQPISDARGSISSSSSVIVHRPSPEAAGSALSAGASTTTATATWSERLSARLRPVVERSMPWLVLLWIVGVSMLSIRLAGGWWRTRALRVAGVSAAPASAQQQLDELCTRLRINRAVALVASVRVAVPVVIGHLKPVVVLPAAALAGLSPSHLEAVLAHELAHVRRHDYLVNLAQTVIETLLFYHPAVWWVSQQVRVAREHCCDDLAVSVCGSRRNYIHALLDLEQLRGSRETFALGATDGSLLGRARRLLRHTEPRSDAPRLAASAIVLTVASVVAAVSFAPLQSVDASPAAAATEAAATSAPEEEATPSAAASAQSGPATPVIASPDTAGTLASRWAWAERAARDARRTRYWIGYTTSPVKGLPRFVYFDRTSRLLGEHMVFTGHTLSDEVTGLKFPGRPLALPGDSSGVKVLYAFDVERGTPVLTTVHVSTVSLPVDLKNHPVFWLGSADGSQGLERVDQLYAKARTIELKDDLIATAGVHDASQAVVAWLSARVASGDADSLRADAAERIAWHPIPESIAALDRIARNDQTSQVRQEAAEALGDLALPDAARSGRGPRRAPGTDRARRARVDRTPGRQRRRSARGGRDARRLQGPARRSTPDRARAYARRHRRAPRGDRDARRRDAEGNARAPAQAACLR
jgi:beta-lactamase regulating signal transducer with metallopeptidase domain